MSNWIRNYFKPWKLLTLVVIATIGYWIYYSVSNKKTTTTSVTLTWSVRVWNIEDSIDVIWTAKLINEQKIRFNQLWRVTNIHFKEWDKVKKWQIIAELDKTDLINSLKQAEISLNNSKIALATDLKPAEEKDKLKYENDLSKSKNDIESSKLQTSNLEIEMNNKISDLENQIKAKELDIENKKNNLILAKSNLDLTMKQEWKNIFDNDIDNQKTIDNAVTDARKHLITANNILVAINSAFWITDDQKYRVYSYEMNISSKDLSYKTDTYANYYSAKSKYDVISSKLSNYSTSWNNIESVSNLYTELRKLFDDLVLLWKSSASAMNASMAWSSFSQSQIDSQYASMNSQYNSAQSSFDSIKSTITNLEKLADPELQKLQSANNITKQKASINDQTIALSNANNDLDSLKKNLEFTKKSYELQFNQKKSDLANQENIMKLSKANYDYLLKWTTKEQIERDKNDIRKQELALEASRKNLDKYQIEAPFDWVLRQIDFKVWDNLVSDDTKYVYIDNPNLLEITAQLDQTEIAKVKNWQKAKMVFDSFPKQSFEWVVTLINPTPIQSAWVTSYEIKLTMDKKDYAIYSWMTAKISIIVENRENVLILPSTFIQKMRWQSYVVMPNWTASWETVWITTWLSNSRMTEITDWLVEWDIVQRTVTVSWSWASRSLFQWPGWGGGGNRQNGGWWDRPPRMD